MAILVGNILPILSRCSQTDASKRWFWSKALEILDRLCDVGAEDRLSAISSVRVVQLQERLDKRLNVEASPQNLVKVVQKAIGVLPRLYKAVLHEMA